MQEHYNINDTEMKALLKRKITPVVLYKNLKHFSKFDEFKSDEPITVISLMHYIDLHGDVEKPPHLPHKRIARAVFNSMSARQRFEILKYTDESEEDEE